MDIETFIERYHIPGTVILMEGYRAVLPGDEVKLEKLGKIIAS